MVPQEQLTNSILMLDIMEYMNKAWYSLKIIWAFALSCITYVMFPETSYLIAFCCVMGAIFLDLLSKWWAIKQTPTAKLSSKALSQGTTKKLFPNLIIFIMLGLAYRITPVKSVVVISGTGVYFMFFMREFVSIIENLCDGGAELEWLLFMAKKQRDEAINTTTSHSRKKVKRWH